MKNLTPDLQLFLSGRSLLASEIPFPREKLDEQISIGNINTIPGIVKKSKRWHCNRCANSTQRLFANFPCANCQNEAGCFYCRKCIMMGRVASCTPLYTWSGPPISSLRKKTFKIPRQKISHPTPSNLPTKFRHTYLSWNGQLSPGQKVASQATIQAVHTKTDILIWAVCGAGKTEVLFEAIDKALLSGYRICIATPRTDVVLELAPRFKKVFPHTKVVALYGGTEDRHVYAPLTISTTHQLMRFEKAFDVMIVDEVDAFPFSYDESLQWAVKKSTKNTAARIFLTATPNEKWQAECKYSKRNHIKIPSRYHRKPLPVPTFKWCGDWRKQFQKGRIPNNVEAWVKKRITSNKQALVFLPHIELMEKALPLFRKLHPEIESVHAEDLYRKEKVEKMRRKKIPLLLTTTILERGVTFPNIDVAVLGAEDDIFTEAALVQISGRVGRSSEFPSGEITFFHHGRTKAMIRALIHIDNMNKEALKKGMMDN
ncbi:DEAD/DEAH box helicase [Lederbergia citri]|uniref:DEAD/DEAH box helicase n=1 Tax=Lederbergia citri TaxID=2833580 RepID=A0A942TD40_9BACI|nr:DEAD/DEAH box helicase [Lederbergia citri]MBS4195518.1 DEAD/DEAH box helicase [Lederbergia citri]